MSNNKEFAWLAGAYGPLESIPLLGDLIGHGLLDMIVIAYSKLGFPSGIYQNDGTVFPTKGRFSLFKGYCERIRSTEKGRARCLASDSQALMNFTGGNKAEIEPTLAKLMEEFGAKTVDEFGSRSQKVFCYRCHAGLLEFVRAVSLDFKDELPSPIGAIWAGQNKVESYALSDNEVLRLAQDIDYPNPTELVALYRQIEPTGKMHLRECAESLAETAHRIEDVASAVFHNKKQMQYDQLTISVLNGLRTSLGKVRITHGETIQKQVCACVTTALEEITRSVGNCYSALCEIREDTGGTKDSRMEIKFVAQAGIGKRKPSKIKIGKGLLDKVFVELEDNGNLKSFSSYNTDWKFFTKLKNAIQVNDIGHVIISRIPAVDIDSQFIWIALFRDNCGVITPRGNPLPSFVEMLQNILQGMFQMINVVYLSARQQDIVRTLEMQKKQLEEKDSVSKLLLRNIAHQVSRPIMELKQSAYILSLGFSEQAYHGFRACLTEPERACRNFDLYEKLTTDLDRRILGLRTRGSFDVMEIVTEAFNRVKPYLRAERRELLTKMDIDHRHSLPHIIGNPEATVTCLVNLFHNAIKYSIGSHPVEVDISHPEPSCVDIRVSSYGIELPEEDWEKVFDEAFRSEGAKTVAVEGSGMGLYISRRLIEMHAGQIKVESSDKAPPTTGGIPRWKTTFLVSLNC